MSDIERYKKLTKVKMGKHPVPYYPVPTENDIKMGYIVRYFVRKSTDKNAMIIEIDEQQFNGWKSTIGLAKAYYTGTQLRWKIVGDMSEIEKINVKTLEKAEKELYGISDYLGSLIEMRM